MAGGVANLKPARKGEVRNPKGKNQHVSPEIKELARAACPAALKRLIGLISSPDERVAMVAAKEILDRGYGRVSQVEGEDGKNNVTIQIVQLPVTQAPAKAKVIEHDGANGHTVAEQVAPATVSVRPLELSAIRGQAGGSGLPS